LEFAPVSTVGSVTAPSPVVAAASQAELGSVRAQAAMEMQVKSVNMQAEAAARLIAAVIELRSAAPALATEGNLGTQLNEVV
jgi:hypothetical protein